MSVMVPSGGSLRVLAPVIPSRFVRLGDQDQPRNHCGLRQIQAALKGVSLAEFADDTGTLDSFYEEMRTEFIPEKTGDAVSDMRTTADWCHAVHFVDGSSTPDLVLPTRFLAYVNVCFLRVLPSLPWYRFVRFRNIDGTEFYRIGGVEPPQDRPMQVPPFTGPYNSGITAASVDISTVQYTGIEDADLMVDTKRRTIRIPPRVLIAGVQFPIWTYTFLPATANVEVHYVSGFAPTRYEDGTPLQYNSQTGYVYDPKPVANPGPFDYVDWSSGMPRAISMSVARLVANKILRMKWRAISNGLASINVDGASESYGGTAYGGDLDKEDEQLRATLAKYGVQVVV